MFRLKKIIIRRMADESPDLSYLEQEEFGAEGRERLEQYGDTWAMVGIRAEAVLLHKDQPGAKSATVHRITSGGLWGVESDSSPEYFKEVAAEELADLRRLCLDLRGVTERDFRELAEIAEEEDGDLDPVAEKYMHVDL